MSRNKAARVTRALLHRGDKFGTYIDGVVGNDKFQINAGASYQEWNGRFPRRIR